jgi:hypothetical protein
MNPLIIYLQPKDELEDVWLQLENIPCDKLVIRYMPYPMCYKAAYQQINEKKEYTHIIWVQNDIIFKKEDYFKLVKDFKETRALILGKAMNVDLSPKGLGLGAFTTEPFEFNSGLDVPFEPLTQRGIIPCFHNGGVFITTREFYLKYPLKGIGQRGYNADFRHGKEIREAGLTYLIDTDEPLKHLRYKGKMMVGKKYPEVEYVKY